MNKIQQKQQTIGKGPQVLQILQLSDTDFKYWIGQEVRSGFCKVLQKNPNKLFGQPNKYAYYVQGDKTRQGI